MDSIRLLTNEQYRVPCHHLTQASIGQHVRHIIEMFQCLENGYEAGEVNYENRKRDPAIESDRELALDLLAGIVNRSGRPDKPLAIRGSYLENTDDSLHVTSSYHREVVYNIDHVIHHMALIRVGFKELNILDMPESFGVAPATVKHRKACAQ